MVKNLAFGAATAGKLGAVSRAAVLHAVVEAGRFTGRGLLQVHLVLGTDHLAVTLVVLVGAVESSVCTSAEREDYLMIEL